MASPPENIIPALRYHWLTRFYDPLLRWTLREKEFRGKLLRQARVAAGDRVLDVGCGTGSFAVLLKQAHPEAHVIGLDADARVLAIARAKAAQAGVDVAFQQGLADALPFAGESFDRVVSTLVLHHLARHAKLGSLREILRVLRPGGEFHLADWGQPANPLMWVLFQLVRGFDSWATTRDHQNGLLPEFIRDAGFQGVRETGYYNTVLGTLRLYAARKPA